jgi:hypothetical protein
VLARGDACAAIISEEVVRSNDLVANIVKIPRARRVRQSEMVEEEEEEAVVVVVEEEKKEKIAESERVIGGGSKEKKRESHCWERIENTGPSRSNVSIREKRAERKINGGVQ